MSMALAADGKSIWRPTSPCSASRSPCARLPIRLSRASQRNAPNMTLKASLGRHPPRSTNASDAPKSLLCEAARLRRLGAVCAQRWLHCNANRSKKLTICTAWVLRYSSTTSCASRLPPSCCASLLSYHWLTRRMSSSTS